MDRRLHTFAVPAVPVARTSTTSSPLTTVTPSDSEKLLTALLRRHNIPLGPLDFWEREFAWVSYQTMFEQETNVSTLLFDIMQEYVIVHSPFLKIKQEGRLVLGSHDTFADGLLYVKRRSIIDRFPDVYIPLSVFELKSRIFAGNDFRQSSIAQLVSAMRDRLWSGDPPYNASWGRLERTFPAQLSHHTPIFGYQFSGTSGRRMIALSPELFFIDTKDTKKNRHVVSYDKSEWTTHLYDHSRVRLDQHVQILRMYAEFIKNLPKERDIEAYGEAYGELASAPIAGTSTQDHGQQKVNLDIGRDKIPSMHRDLYSANELDLEDEELEYDEMAREFYIRVTKEMDDEMRRCIRPMWTMTTEERKRVFGFLGPDWELFATWYVGCPVVTG
jgi:hypothetical protein